MGMTSRASPDRNKKRICPSLLPRPLLHHLWFKAGNTGFQDELGHPVCLLLDLGSESKVDFSCTGGAGYKMSVDTAFLPPTPLAPLMSEGR